MKVVDVLQLLVIKSKAANFISKLDNEESIENLLNPTFPSNFSDRETLEVRMINLA